jgi:HEPN domain-containing protein
MLNDNYLKTAERMYDSAKILHQANHSFNSCYLSGYVAECYAKIMYYKLAHGRVRLKSHDTIDILSNVSSLLTSSSSYNKYLIDMPIECPNMCAGAAKWHPFERYSDIHPWTAPISALFQQEMDIFFDKITEMIIDGVIS